MDGVWKDPAMLGKLIFDDYGVQLKARLLEHLDWLRENPEKVVQYGVMFLALVAIYAVYLKDFIEAARKGWPDADAFGMSAIVRFVAFAGWPFAIMALVAKTWTRKDAGKVALAAYAVSASVWVHRYELHACVAGLAALFFPLVMSACICHGIGRLSLRRKMPAILVRAVRK